MNNMFRSLIVTHVLYLQTTKCIYVVVHTHFIIQYTINIVYNTHSIKFVFSLFLLFHGKI